MDAILPEGVPEEFEVRYREFHLKFCDDPGHTAWFDWMADRAERGALNFSIPNTTVDGRKVLAVYENGSHYHNLIL
jgi:hypothetical protein